MVGVLHVPTQDRLSAWLYMLRRETECVDLGRAGDIDAVLSGRKTRRARHDWRIYAVESPGPYLGGCSYALRKRPRHLLRLLKLATDSYEAHAPGTDICGESDGNPSFGPRFDLRFAASATARRHIDVRVRRLRVGEGRAKQIEHSAGTHHRRGH